MAGKGAITGQMGMKKMTTQTVSHRYEDKCVGGRKGSDESSGSGLCLGGKLLRGSN